MADRGFILAFRNLCTFRVSDPEHINGSGSGRCWPKSTFCKTLKDLTAAMPQYIYQHISAERKCLHNIQFSIPAGFILLINPTTPFRKNYNQFFKELFFNSALPQKFFKLNGLLHVPVGLAELRQTPVPQQLRILKINSFKTVNWMYRNKFYSQYQQVFFKR